MHFSFLVVLSSIAFTSALSNPKKFAPRAGFKVGGFTPTPFRSPGPDHVSPNVLLLRRAPGSLSHQYLRSLQHGNQVNGVYGITPVYSDDYSTSFLAPIEFANQMFEVIVDTGSSDTWLAETGYQCVDVATQAHRYAINVDAIVYSGSHKTKLSPSLWPSPLKQPAKPSQIRAIVDSGTTLNYLPTAMANAINGLFSPPAQYVDNQGAYIVQCNAKAPKLGVTISGKTFTINPQDLILDLGFGDGTCISGIDDGGPGLYILGNMFLKNVLAVFGVGAGQMRFAAREFY